MCKLKSSCKLDQCAESFLFKEDWDTSSDLTVTYKEIINFNDLLSMNKISDIPIFINSSIKVSGTSFTIRTPWDKNIGNFSALNKYFETIDVALNNWKTPLFLNFIFVKFNKKTFIPSKSIFRTHLLMLEWLSEVILVGEIEAISEDFVELSDFFEDLFFLWFEWELSVAEVTEKI